MAVEKGREGWASRLRPKERAHCGQAVSWTDPLSLQFTRCSSEPRGWIKQKVALALCHLSCGTAKKGSLLEFEVKPKRQGPWKAQCGPCSGTAQRKIPR